MMHFYSTTGEMKDVFSEKDGIKRGLYPSVTTILSIVAKPGLEYWKREGVVLTADSNKRLEGETDRDYFKRVDKLFNSSNKAASIGTALHKFAEGRAGPLLGYEAVCKLIQEWKDANLGNGVAEESFTYEDEGVGGTIDWYGYDKQNRKTVVDWKSQKPKEGKLTFYKEWRAQLAQYSKCDTSMRHISVVFSSDPLQPMLDAKEYTREEIEDGYKFFKACQVCWNFTNLE